MTPTNGPPKKGLLLIPDDKGGPPPLQSPDNPLEEKQEGSGSQECENCVFYSTADQNCKRYPEWVPHSPEEWCGEFKAGAPHADADAQVPGHATPPQNSQPNPYMNHSTAAGGPPRNQPY